MAAKKPGQLLATASAPPISTGRPAAAASTVRLMTTRWSLWPQRGPAGGCRALRRTVTVPPSLAIQPPSLRSSCSMAAMRSLSFRRRRPALTMTVSPSHSRPRAISTGPRSGQSARSIRAPCSLLLKKRNPPGAGSIRPPHRRRMSRMTASPCRVSGSSPATVTSPARAPSTAGKAAWLQSPSMVRSRGR